jgi:hypothetical protein
MKCKDHVKCRCCGSDKLEPYLDLGMMPLANNLELTKEDAINAQRFPLKVLLCQDCSLSQLSVVIDPELLFSNYFYRSSMSQGYKDHCKQMAIDLKEKYGFNGDSFIIDIAGNDGALLHEFEKVIKPWKSLNVDPAKNLVKANEALGVRQYCVFWGMEAAKQLQNTCWPKADLITATNVFAHVDDVKGFLEAAKFALKPEGVIVIEFPYIRDFIEKGEFDTVYFEHLSYFSITPLELLAFDCDLHIANITKQNIHGGSVRVELKHGAKVGFAELGLPEFFIDYKTYSDKVQECVEAFKKGIANLDGTVACFAASAKGNTLLNVVGETSRIEYIVDETPEKIGKYSPGTGIEVVPLIHLSAFPVDYLIILSWNFADEIISKCKAAGYTGKFIIPIPTWQIVE